jgi:hypothetical protein
VKRVAGSGDHRRHVPRESARHESAWLRVTHMFAVLHVVALRLLVLSDV